MSYPLLTPPIGLGWDFKTTPKWTTTEQTPQSGRGAVTATQQESVIYEFELAWNYLKASRYVPNASPANDFSYLRNFYEAMRGSWGRFLFDPSTIGFANLTLSQLTTAIDNGFCGLGDGATTVFPMWRSSSVLGGGLVTLQERIQNVSLLTGVYVGGALQVPTAYTQSNFPGTLTFNTAPASGASVCWAGNYNYLVHFATDSMDFNEFMYQLYELKSCTLETINL